MNLNQPIDCIIALGEGMRLDGSASNPTQAAGEKVIDVVESSNLKVPIIISGGSMVRGITEGMAIEKLLNKNNIKNLFVSDTKIFPSGTHLQPGAVQKRIKKINPKSVILITHPVHSSRALWVFSEYFPDIKFIPIVSKDVYDKKMIQVRLHNKILFTTWNSIAWIHNYLFYKVK